MKVLKKQRDDDVFHTHAHVCKCAARHHADAVRLDHGGAGLP